MEQQPGTQKLSEVINASTIAGFLASDPAHVAIFDTLLNLPLTGVDAEIRSEFANGTVVRFPVLTLCLEGLERLLDKHELAKQVLQEKIDSEGRQPGVNENLVQNLPIARIGLLSAGPVSDELGSIKMNLEAAYNEKLKRIEAKHAQELANIRIQVKENMVRLRAGTMAKYGKPLEEQQKQHTINYKSRMQLNTKTFQLLLDKWYIDVKSEGGASERMPYRTAAKLISEDPKMFNTYKGLCIQAVKKYKRELKDQYRTHLHDIELECRQWLKDNASGRLGAEEASDGLKQTLFGARAWDAVSILNPGRKDKMENPSIYLRQDEMEEEVSEMRAEFHALQQKDVSEGGLDLQPVQFQNGLLEAAIQVRNS